MLEARETSKDSMSDGILEAGGKRSQVRRGQGGEDHYLPCLLSFGYVPAFPLFSLPPPT